MVEVIVRRNGSRAIVYVLDEVNVYGGRPVKDTFSFECEDWTIIQEAVNGYLRKHSEK